MPMENLDTTKNREYDDWELLLGEVIQEDAELFYLDSLLGELFSPAS